MSKTLILHIGHYKTGTTALQVFFEENPDVLAEYGFQYPDVWMTHSKHSDFAFSILRAAGVKTLMHGYPIKVTPQDMWNDLYFHIEKEDSPYTLVSSEEFMRLGQFPAALDILREVLNNRPSGVNVKVIAYLRDPAAHLHSWYNQLIKMNFKIPDLDQAVNDDIEDIHLDYRHALSPWIDILGAENVLIRPYIKDLENPAALHQDFMAAFDVSLPANLVPNAEDLNPRLDDRLVDLVRLMQNLNYPRATIDTINRQAQSYMDAQDDLLNTQDIGMSNVATRAQDGLNWLAGLPDNHIDIAEFSRNLPKASPAGQVSQTQLLGFVFSELIQLRQRVNKFKTADILERIQALEHKLDQLESDT